MASQLGHDGAVQEIRRTLVDPIRVVERLGLGAGATRQSGGGVTIRCPLHSEKTPSCSVSKGGDGTIRFRCFGCQASGDVLTLVAAARGLDVKRDFKDVLATAAEAWNMTALLAELDGATPAAPRELPPLPEPEPSRDYPPLEEVVDVWFSAVPVEQIEQAQVALALRSLHPDASLARALTGSTLPSWARYQGKAWCDSGHRIVLPTYDAHGIMRSLRAWQVNRDAPGPKRLPPAGHRASGLVLANVHAVSMLREPSAPLRLMVVEGEPDFLSAAQAWPWLAIIGVGSGSWGQDFADRVPLGSEIAIHTHHDLAGEKYAADIKSSLAKRAIITRSKKP